MKPEKEIDKLSNNFIQPQVEIGDTDNEYEKKSNEIADSGMRMSEDEQMPKMNAGSESIKMRSDAEYSIKMADPNEGKIRMMVDYPSLSNDKYSSVSSVVDYTPQELDRRFGSGFVKIFLPAYIDIVISALKKTNDPDLALSDGISFVIGYPWKSLPDREGKLTVDLAMFKSAIEYVVDVEYKNEEGKLVQGEQFVDGSEWIKLPGFTTDFYPENNSVRNPGVIDVKGTPNGSRVNVILELTGNDMVHKEVYDKLTNWGATDIQISNMRVELWLWVDLSVIPEN